jgi:hypothetical protein
LFKYFTRRYCLDRPKYDLKYEYIPQASRSDFYKLIRAKSEEIVSLYCFYREASVVVNRNSVRLYNSDDIESYFNPDLLIELLLDVEWHEFLSITEFASNETDISIDEINQILEYHRVGYRLEKNSLTEEAEAIVHYDTLIEDAKALLDKNIEYEGVLSSVETARNLLSNPKENNIESAVKASIDSIEGYLRGWLGSKGHRVATLGDSIKVLRNSQLAPPRIIKSLEELYIFRNSEPNVGHGSPEKGNLQRDDALLCFEMAISFINYFYRKSQKGE